MRSPVQSPTDEGDEIREGPYRGLAPVLSTAPGRSWQSITRSAWGFLSVLGLPTPKANGYHLDIQNNLLI